MFKFAHMADNHIGYRQYNMNQRRRDFAEATFEAMNICISEQVDFVIIAGDFFHIKDPHWVDLYTAKYVFDELEQEHIRFYANLGNHDYPRIYDEYDWRFLFNIFSFKKKQIHVDTNCTITGLDWQGNNTEKAVKSLPKDSVYNNYFNILVLHAGVDGILGNSFHNVKQETLLALKNNPFHYVALGHIHKPYEIDNYIFNPGSLEACSVTEQEYKDRGIYIVTVNDDNTFTAEKHIIKGRKFYSLNASQIGQEELKEQAVIKINLDTGTEDEARGKVNQYKPLHVIVKKPNQFSLEDVNSKIVSTDKEAIYKSVFGDQVSRAVKAETAITKQTDIEKEVFG